MEKNMKQSKVGNETEMYIISILFRIVHEILTEAIRQENKIKEIQLRKSNYTIYK